MEISQMELYTNNPKQFIIRMDELINKAYDKDDNREEAIAGGAILFAFEYYGRKKMDEEELLRCSQAIGNVYLLLHNECKFPLSAGEP